MNTARNFHWLYCRAKACCYPHLPIPLSMNVAAFNTDKNVRPSFSGAIGGHSLPENAIRIASALGLCIQASKYMYMMFHYRPLSMYQQITTVLAHKQHTHTHTRFTASDSAHSHIYMIKMHKTVNSTVVLPQREGAHAWRYIHACHSKHTICTVHLQFCKLHDHNLCTVRVADSAIKPYAYTATFNDCMIKTFLFSYTVCRGHKLTNSTCTHTQTHTTQRHNYHKFQEQHTSANHSATGTSSDNVTNTYSESRPKAQAHLPCHPS